MLIVELLLQKASVFIHHSTSTKRKSSSKGKAAKGDAKRSCGSLERDWTEKINSADITDCLAIQSTLESILGKAKERIALLNEEVENQGLSYKGEDKVECGCGNTFQSEGDYGKTCEECPEEKREEKCIECTKVCKGDNCGGKILCGDCKTSCSSCEEAFCNECLVECCSCTLQFCGGSDYCQLLDVGYSGDTECCKGCIEERR